MVVGATIGMIFTKVEIPQWWPPLAVAVVGYLFGITNGTLRMGGGGQ
jgi:xanthosine utilization system XapX-like protein